MTDADAPSPAADTVLEELEEDECLALLAARQFGRLAVVRDGHPEIFPVNYVLSGRTVVIRTQAGVKLTNASLARVAFEVDEIDPGTRQGWSVEVRGVGEDVTDGADPWSEAALRAPVDPWVPGPHDHTIAISHPVFSGRRLHRPG
jgi:nitroimidazol reductase NimA-like FMN-containing flavoprotein (pyridoxamine 5'-phosphate oxidase superfamily)